MAKTPLTAAATIILAFAVTLATFQTGTNGSSSPAAAPGPSGMAAAPGPALDCFPYLLNLSDCLTYVEAGSNLSKPDKGCCPELANLVAVQPVCLCQLLGNPKQAPVAINLPKALGLPSVCKVDTPPVSLCSVLGVPVSAPVPAGSLSPEGAANSSPAASPPKNNDNGGQNIISSQRHFLVGLAVVLYTTFF